MYTSNGTEQNDQIYWGYFIALENVLEQSILFLKTYFFIGTRKLFGYTLFCRPRMLYHFRHRVETTTILGAVLCDMGTTPKTQNWSQNLICWACRIIYDWKNSDRTALVTGPDMSWCLLPQRLLVPPRLALYVWPVRSLFGTVMMCVEVFVIIQRRKCMAHREFMCQESRQD